MIGRRIVELLLVAAIVPLGAVGVQQWRERAQPAPPATASAARVVRAQLGGSGRVPVRATTPAMPADVEAPVTAGQLHAAMPATDEAERVRASVPDDLRVAPRLGGPAAPAPASGSTVERRPLRGATGGGAFGGSPGPASPVAAALAPTAIEFVGLMQDQTLVSRNDFLADFVRHLKIIVYWNVAGPHSQRLELFTPSGALYRRFTADFTGGGTRTAVETLLPVGGTWITEHSLFGTWRVDVYLDAQRTPATTAAFVLTH